MRYEPKPYQDFATKHIVENEVTALDGSGLFLEMGLGKTIMVIGLMLSNFKPKTLIVLPPVLIDQWFIQILRTTGHKALIYYGANKKKITIEQ